ncbi:hypothetical protein [Sulfurimonas sp.]
MSVEEFLEKNGEPLSQEGRRLRAKHNRYYKRPQLKPQQKSDFLKIRKLDSLPHESLIDRTKERVCRIFARIA